MKVYSDKYKRYAEERAEMYGDMFDELNIVPADMYGKRVNLKKDDPTNLEKTGEDIKEFYGLDD